jgi:hypothetical protein
MLTGATKLSPVTKLVTSTGAVLSRRSEAESGVAVLPIAIGTVSKPENCQVTEDKIASRCGYPGTRFRSIYLRSRVLQKP